MNEIPNEYRSNRFAGRCAIVTGGASGLGRVVAARIAAEGGRVALWDMDGEALKKAEKTIQASHSVALDVSDWTAVNRTMRETVAVLNRLDILVNSAGITGATAPTHEFPIASWLRVIDVNLNGTFYCCRESVPFMLQNGYGRIVNVASVAGKEGNPNASAYSTSKAGVIGLTKSLGKELATKGVIVNAIAPATFDSPLLAQMPQSHVDYMRSKIPMGRLAEVGEIAAMICFMASEECSFTTAQVFDTTGGRATY